MSTEQDKLVALHSILYCIDGKQWELNERNQGEADKWDRQVMNAYRNFEEKFEQSAYDFLLEYIRAKK